LTLPERFKRKPATIIAEQAAEAGLAPAPTINRNWLQRFDALLEGHDIFDQVRAKLFRALYIAFKAEADALDPTAENAVAGGRSALLQNARDCFQSALTFDKNAGVKKLIEALDRELKKVPTTPESGTTETANDA